MTEEQNVPNKEEIICPPIMMMAESDRKFIQNLHEFIDQEKQYLQCPEEGGDELRYITYRSAFNKVIGQTVAYKRLLLNIKAEYDETIRELKSRQEAAAITSARHQSVVICERRATHLRARISVLQTQTAELQEEITRRSSNNQSTWLPGLTAAQSDDLQVLQKHLEDLKTQRAALVDRKTQYVPLEVQTKLETELQAAKHLRDHLSSEKEQLILLYKRLRFVLDRLTCWDEAGQKVPLEQVLASTLQNIQHLGSESVNETDDESCRDDTVLFEDEEQAKLDRSKLLNVHLDRFVELFTSAQYEEAALQAARSPGGVLRNTDTMTMFKGVQGPPGSSSPAFLFFQALLVTMATGNQLSGDMSFQGVSSALQHGDLQLVTHAITQNKLMFTEELGDVLTQHAQKNPSVSDLCLALATIVYDTCRIDKKSALSMCRRGLIHSAAELMKQNLTADDCMWVLSRFSGLSLLQLLMEPSQGQTAKLSVGVACSALLVDPQRRQLALQLLDGFMSRGQDMLESIILEDSSCLVDLWVHVASLCADLNRDDLNQAIRTVLLNQNGTRVQSPDPEGARLMEHVYL